MEHLFVVQEITEKQSVADRVKMLVIDKEFINEMGEPIIWNKNQKWLFCLYSDIMIGFVCHDNASILYAYTKNEFRERGVFNFLYSKLPVLPFKTVSSNLSLPIFLSKGFKIVKSFKTCHKLKKI